MAMTDNEIAVFENIADFLASDDGLADEVFKVAEEQGDLPDNDDTDGWDEVNRKIMAKAMLEIIKDWGVDISSLL